MAVVEVMAAEAEAVDMAMAEMVAMAEMAETAVEAVPVALIIITKLMENLV